MSASKKPVVWEALDQGGGSFLNLRRTPVPTGWLVASGPEMKDLIFVPDPQHDWLTPPWGEHIESEGEKTTKE